MIFLIWLAVLACVAALYFHKVYSKFSNYGVNHLKPVPVIGNTGQILLRKLHTVEHSTHLYNAFPEDRFVGNYVFFRPTVVVRDLDLIKKVTIKDFEHFVNRTSFVDEKSDPLMGRTLFFLRDQEWKDMRARLSPAFTSSKMRLMVPFMIEVSNQMAKSIKKSIQDSKDNYVDEDCKDLSTRFANDVIASCAFGFKVDSHNEKENEFYKMGKLITTASFKQFLVFTALTSFPNLVKKLKLTSFDPTIRDFFKNLVLNTMNERDEKNIIRPDMIHLLMEAKKGKLTHDDKNAQDEDAGFATVEETAVGKRTVDNVWSDNDLIAQAVLFLLAGFGTVSSTTSFLLYEIAMNPKVQERLVQEIKDNHSKNGGKFDYKSVQDLTYMDMVVSESLRKWPSVSALDRKCVKDYNLGKPHSKASRDYIIRKGEVINIPTWAIHHDPEYYPDPEKFDPERFSEENKHRIKPFTYLPFGLGPRNCIGSRFALCEVKVMLYHILLQFELSPCEKTCIPAKLEAGTISPTLKGGHWLRFRIREA